MPLESIYKVALIVEAGVRSDLRQGSLFRLTEFPGTLIEAKPAHILTNRAPIMSPKHAGEVRGVYCGYVPKLLKADTFVEVRMEVIS